MSEPIIIPRREYDALKARVTELEHDRTVLVECVSNLNLTLEYMRDLIVQQSHINQRILEAIPSTEPAARSPDSEAVAGTDGRISNDGRLGTGCGTSVSALNLMLADIYSTIQVDRRRGAL